MSGSSQQAPTQQTTYKLSPEQRQLMQLAMPGVREFAARVPQRFPGSTVAGFDPSQVAGQEAVLGSAVPQADLAANAGNLTNYWLQPDVWSPEQNEMLSSAIGAATRPIWEGYEERVLPAIRSEAVNVGGFGGSRQGVAEGLAAREAFKSAGDVGISKRNPIHFV